MPPPHVVSAHAMAFLPHHAEEVSPRPGPSATPQPVDRALEVDGGTSLNADRVSVGSEERHAVEGRSSAMDAGTAPSGSRLSTGASQKTNTSAIVGALPVE